MKIAVVGGGLAGLACGARLSEGSHTVKVYDKARAGLVAPWAAAGSEAWVDVPAMTAPALALAADLDLHTSARVVPLRREWHVEGEGFGAGPFDGAIIALPAEQARTLVRAR